MAERAGKLGPLAERQFRLLWLARVSSSVGDAMVAVALAFAVLSVSRAPVALGAVLAVFTISRVSLTLVGGVFADRLPRRVVMLTCDAIRALVEAFTAVMLLTGHMTLPLFFVTAAVFGGASAFFGPAATGLVPQTVSRARLQEANALLGLSQAAANVVGPAVSGIAVAAAGAGWVFAADAVTFAASALFLLRLRVAEAERVETPRFLGALARGLNEVRSRSWVWLALVSFSATNVCYAAFIVLGPVVARDDLGGARQWGVIVTGGALGAVAGGAVALRVRPPRPLTAAFGAATLLALPVIALAPPLPTGVVAAAYAAGMAGIAFGTALWQTTLQTRIPGDVLARVSSYDWLVSLVFMPVGFVAFGPIASAVGLVPTLAVTGAAIAVVNVAVALSRPIRGVVPPAPEATQTARTDVRAAA